jgi:hypothetical protein
LIVTVTKILYIANRARPDMVTFKSYMTKITLHPTVEHGKKLYLEMIRPYEVMVTTVIIYEIVRSQS